MIIKYACNENVASSNIGKEYLSSKHKKVIWHIRQTLLLSSM